MLDSTTMICYFSLASNTYLLPSICSVTNDGQISPHWLWLIAQNALAWALVASLWHQSEEELILSIIRYVQEKGLKAKSHFLTWRSSVVNVICAVAAASLFALQEIAGKHHMRFEFGTLTSLALVSTVGFNTAYLSRHLWLQHCGEDVECDSIGENSCRSSYTSCTRASTGLRSRNAAESSRTVGDGPDRR